MFCAGISSGKSIEINRLERRAYEGFANFSFVQILCCKCFLTMHKLWSAQRQID
ncbi:hypothetical protein RHECIAT_CH0003860 [Rhizobium etli CIAT 652]|uniref:Uncharacterized protein n=1 Tax=Rhizobium etli (strain CIAT 652) TaxID=491916 RepID=B3PZZ7_RHIE6|nr:hypothetical protein RHECIAT_CH0003860 [Rhizobium etli CIAT 652]KKZ88296.1 hypothetical protein RPHASCH2410_CH03885 [Rhizobium phaseoli Ch24-10]